MMRRLSTIAVAVLLGGALACSKGREQGEAFRPIAVGDTAPAYSATTLAGAPMRVGAGTPILLNVWATWCTSCKEEMADLAALERKYQPQGVRVLAVSVDNGDGTRVRRFVESERLPFAVAHDPAGEVQQRFQAVGVPETYLIAGDGRMLWVRRGGLHDAPEGVLASLDQAVKQLR
jgi:peroxiredoxin